MTNNIFKQYKYKIWRWHLFLEFLELDLAFVFAADHVKFKDISYKYKY